MTNRFFNHPSTQPLQSCKPHGVIALESSRLSEESFETPSSNVQTLEKSKNFQKDRMRESKLTKDDKEVHEHLLYEQSVEGAVEGMRKFYRKVGFVERRFLYGYYKSGADAVEMVKEISKGSKRPVKTL
ncbi:unnamed protein product [Phytomonas sp. Hart1]|nr:unnamed protein product [Phytomonas sp. Hart1]|eukprot:CCW68031.1 unnamed protein product [Phytomonas sp. isolate Hart1]